MADKLFGTDGMRGIANVYPLTVDFCLKLGNILGQHFCTAKKRIAIARDTRISGTMLFNTLSAGLTAQGIDVLDLGIIPTPLCTTLTPDLEVDMSIMITASHNPYRDNGIKLINAKGDKFSDADTAKVEELMQAPYTPQYDAQKIGQVIACESGIDDYFEAVNSLTDADALHGMKIAIDSANGAFSDILPYVFKYLGAEVISLADTPDGYNINENCGSQHTENLSATVVNNGCRIGIAVDGDGDRIIICDETGKRLNGDQIIAYLAKYLKEHNLLKGNAVVSTMYSNMGLGKYIRSLGLEHYASAVGERYVIEKMREVGSNLGGEESGHMVLSDYSRTGDALIAAIVVCLGIYESGKQVSEVFPVFTPFPTEAHNLKFDNKEIIGKILDNPQVKTCMDEVKQRLAGHGSLIIRKSGTEPVIRLKIEDENAEVAAEQAKIMLDCINKCA
jgi:phosphoglucosamine mutase